MTHSLTPFAAFAALALPAALLASCPMHPHAPPALSANHDCCRIAQADWEKTLATAQPSANSLYQVESRWNRQDASEIPLSSLAGRPQVLALAYTNCQYACPRLLADLKAIEALLPPDAPVGFLIVTIDTERDTPARLRAYAAEQSLDPARWTLLQGSPGDTLELANLLGVRYDKMPNDLDYTHSNLITVLDARGEVVHQQIGLGADNAPTLAALQRLLHR